MMRAYFRQEKRGGARHGRTGHPDPAHWLRRRFVFPGLLPGALQQGPVCFADPGLPDLLRPVRPAGGLQRVPEPAGQHRPEPDADQVPGVPGGPLEGLGGGVHGAAPAFALLTWNGPVSLLPAVGTAAGTIACWTNNARTIRVVNLILGCPCSLTYDALVGSWAGVLNEGLAMAAIVISILRFGWSALDGDGVKETVSEEGGLSAKKSWKNLCRKYAKSQMSS